MMMDDVFAASSGFLGFEGNDDDFSSVFSSEANSDAPSVSDDSHYFFKCVLVTDEKTRLAACNRLTSILRKELNGNVALVEKHIPTIVRFAYRCPFAEVANHFQTFLKEITPQLSAVNISIPQCTPSCSFFFPQDALLTLDDPREEVSKIFQESFLRTGRVSHLTQLLAWHPIYYNSHLESYLHFMYNTTVSLPLHKRNFIAMMAAARLKCSYIVKEQEREFLLNDGDREWLDNNETVPPLLNNLKEVNAILAHQPWKITGEHIGKLVRNSKWTLPSLVHAFIIMASTRATSSFALSMGVVPEVDYGVNISVQQHNPDSYEQADEAQTADVIDKLLQSNGRDLRNSEGNNSPRHKVQVFASVTTNLPMATSTHLGREDLQSVASPCGGQFLIESGEWTEVLEARFNSEFSKLTYQDFDTESTEYQILYSEDFSWDTRGFPLVKRFFPTFAEQLDGGFKCIRNMTYESFNEQKSIDTRPFRMAIWYYVHRLYGIYHDDFNYHTINKYVHTRIKGFIKKAVCFPHTFTLEDLANMGVRLQPEEKAHIALLVTEAKKQAELLYALNAISKYLAL